MNIYRRERYWQIETGNSLYMIRHSLQLASEPPLLPLEKVVDDLCKLIKSFECLTLSQIDTATSKEDMSDLKMYLLIPPEGHDSEFEWTDDSINDERAALIEAGDRTERDACDAEEGEFPQPWKVMEMKFSRMLPCDIPQTDPKN